MKIIVAGGGTAGHINPAIAIAKSIRHKIPDAQILFIGTKRGMETKLVPREGFELKLIQVKGFRRKISLDTLRSIKALIEGLRQTNRILKEFKPDIVIGTGGYVCGPVVFNAARMKIPTLIHEQNAFPGVTNKILARFVDKVAISFKESSTYFGKKYKLVLTGNPLRNEMLSINRNEARKHLGIKENKPLIVIFGGSLGAEKINESVVDMLLNFIKEEDCKIIFATGENRYSQTINNLGEYNNKNIEVVPYIYDMPIVLAAADLAICRAGAITISELSAVGVPAILIPSPNVTANHQEYNARVLEKNGAAVVILEKDLSGEVLYQQMIELIRDSDNLRKMIENAKKNGNINSSSKIISILSEICPKFRDNVSK